MNIFEKIWLAILAGAVLWTGCGFLRARRIYLRAKAIHERFMIEDALCRAARERGDWETAKKHLDYMEVLHKSHLR